MRTAPTRWLNSDKALVQLSIRYPWADVFWFSLFHEIGHLLLHDRSSVFIEDKNREQQDLEDEADQFAADELIPPASFRAFIQRPDRRTQAAVVEFAEDIGVAPVLSLADSTTKGISPTHTSTISAPGSLGPKRHSPRR